MVVGLAYFAAESYNLYTIIARKGKDLQRPATVDPNLPRLVVNAGKPILIIIIITRSSCGSWKSGQGEVSDKRKNQMDRVERAQKRTCSGRTRGSDVQANSYEFVWVGGRNTNRYRVRVET